MPSNPPTQLERPRSVSQIIGEALEIYRRYPLLFVALALSVIAPYELAVLAATGEGPLSTQAHRSADVSILLLLLEYALVQALGYGLDQGR